MPKGISKERDRRMAGMDQLWRPGGSTERTRLDKEADKWYMVKEVAKGRTYEDIAVEMTERCGYNVDRYMIRRSVDEALVEWKRENMGNIDAYIAKDLLRIEEIERKVEREFELSKSSLRPNEYASLMKRGLTPEEIDDMYRERPMPGDPRYLEVLLHLQQQRMRLLGIDRGNDVDQRTIISYQFNGIGDEALSKMADMLQDGYKADEQ